MKKVILINTCIFVLLSSVQCQVNSIFKGGDSDGWNLQTFIIPQNNQIFAGGNMDGHAINHYMKPQNNSIFTGGIEDGFSYDIYIHPSNNSIFEGGIEDGFSFDTYIQPKNNLIFAGGINDGFSFDTYIQPNNNSIFAGGINDGIDWSSYTNVVWSGNIDEDWHKSGNWFGNKIPLSNDNVRIPENRPFYPLLSDGLLVVNSELLGKFECLNLKLDQGSSFTLDIDAFLENSGEIDISGNFHVRNLDEESVKNLGIGLIHLRSSGAFMIKNN